MPPEKKKIIISYSVNNNENTYIYYCVQLAIRPDTKKKEKKSVLDKLNYWD